MRAVLLLLLSLVVFRLRLMNSHDLLSTHQVICEFLLKLKYRLEDVLVVNVELRHDCLNGWKIIDEDSLPLDLLESFELFGALTELNVCLFEYADALDLTIFLRSFVLSLSLHGHISKNLVPLHIFAICSYLSMLNMIFELVLRQGLECLH
jgi:hypothetical protein